MRDTVKSWLAGAVAALSRAGSNGPAFARELTAWVLAHVDERTRVTTRHGAFTLRVGNPVERWRALTLLDKEAETIAWIDATLAADGVFLDVGANIGVYTLYAAHRHAGIRVVAFEPEAMNFARLNQNIHDNNLSGRVLAFPLAVSDSDGLMVFRLSRLQAGAALHGDREVKPGAEAHRQGAVKLPLDSILAALPDLPPPTHLKVDVDGPELEVLRGAAATLARPSLRHVLVELTTGEAPQAVALLAAAGFQLVETGPVADGMANHIFARRE